MSCQSYDNPDFILPARSTSCFLFGVDTLSCQMVISILIFSSNIPLLKWEQIWNMPPVIGNYIAIPIQKQSSVYMFIFSDYFLKAPVVFTVFHQQVSRQTDIVGYILKSLSRF